MRILQINLEKGWRGGERQTLFILQGLQAAGHSVGLAARCGGPLAKRAKEAGIPILPCRGTADLLRALWRVRASFDVMHAQTAQAMTVLAVLRPVLKAALVFTRRTAFQSGGRPWRQRWKWARADALVAISAAAAAAPRDLGLEVQLIPSAVQPMLPDPAQVQALRARFGLDGHRVLVTAAALSPEKDPLTLIEAVHQLRQQHPDVVCLHCGAEGAAAAGARACVDALGLQKHYLFAGFQSQVGNVLAVADVYVSSSRFEALGTSVLDACLAGLPVVATRVGGHPEILLPDRGLLVPAGDAAHLAQRLAWVLDHRDAAREMAERAQAHVRQEYSVPAMVERYLRLYRGVVSN
ncbi:glycosyltransferase family 4 protein [Castellaniella sp.]|uniref:glycosyltransferase family 4 protein n=1 Tax=Castellaniella sp. TaxID=1955812 RepID=UPI003A943DFE